LARQTTPHNALKSVHGGYRRRNCAAPDSTRHGLPYARQAAPQGAHGITTHIHRTGSRAATRSSGCADPAKKIAGSARGQQDSGGHTGSRFRDADVPCRSTTGHHPVGAAAGQVNYLPAPETKLRQ